jgi:ribonuclease BN (tRNA processing enzyme)
MDPGSSIPSDIWMKVRILGCSGGIGGHHLRTTSILVDHDILIDAGTGLGDLSISELTQIDHVFLTHSHLDHIACWPLMVDTVGDLRDRPLIVHATEAVIEILRAHVFNWLIWPDFAEIPSADSPFLRFQSIRVGEPVVLAGRTITPLPANHTVPAVGYALNSGKTTLVFSGDTAACPEQWSEINKISNLRYLIYECAFPNREHALAQTSKHLCPNMLSEELKHLKTEVELYITHLKPGQIEMTMSEIEECMGRFRPQMLQNGLVLEL